MGILDSLKYIMNKYGITNIPTHNAPIELPITRVEMATLFWELGYTLGVELGVDEGIYSEALCKANPDLHLYGVDAWTAYQGYSDYTRQTTLNTHMDTALARMAPYNYTVIRKFTNDALGDFKDRSLDFVYIDASHEFLHVTEDIAHWSIKVREGGILSGHDYRRTSNAWICQVVDVVNGWTNSHKIKPWFVTDRVDTQSWFWVVA